MFYLKRKVENQLRGMAILATMIRPRTDQRIGRIHDRASRIERPVAAVNSISTNCSNSVC